MFKIIVVVFMILLGFYYVDVIGKFLKDERAGNKSYRLGRLVFPFGYWMFPLKPKKKRNVKSKKLKTNEAK